MNRLNLIGLTAAALFALAACDDKKTETKPEDPSVKNATTTTTATASVAATTTATATTVAINDTDISTPADFEESAEKAIDKKNYKAELSTLDTDISKE